MTQTHAHSITAPLRRILRARFAVLALAASLLGAVGAHAQNPFSAAVQVNDSVVTFYEIEQRARLLEVLRAPGDLREQARETLIEERLQVQEAGRLGFLAAPEEVERGVAEFAARADLTADELLANIAQEGIAPETLRDFVANGISWRNVIQRRFSNAARPAAADPERAIELQPRQANASILVAEIVIPLTPENQENLRVELGRLADEIGNSTDVFSQAARQFSAAGTRENGGVTGWRPLSEVPPTLRENLVTLNVGEVFGPVSLGPALALFQMRGLRENAFTRLPSTSVSYATIPLPGGTSPEALAARAQLRADVDTCLDLNGARPGAFEQFDQPVGEIPDDIALALAALDDGEIAYTVTRNAGAVTLAVMLCDRAMAPPPAGLDGVRGLLFSVELERLADGLLEELRAAAIIDTDP